MTRPRATMRITTATITSAAAIAIAISFTGCETFGSRICDRSAEANPPVRYTGGATENGVYMSSPWDGELLNFPGGMHYELVHGLGVTPREIEAWISFDRSPSPDGGKLAQAAGNQAVVVSADAETIVIANDTCGDYWLLVTAGSGSPQPGP